MAVEGVGNVCSLHGMGSYEKRLAGEKMLKKRKERQEMESSFLIIHLSSRAQVVFQSG